MFKIFSIYIYLLNKYLKCSVWRLALRYDIYIYIYIYVVRLQKVNAIVRAIFGEEEELCIAFTYVLQCTGAS